MQSGNWVGSVVRNSQLLPPSLSRPQGEGVRHNVHDEGVRAHAGLWPDQLAALNTLLGAIAQPYPEIELAAGDNLPWRIEEGVRGTWRVHSRIVIASLWEVCCLGRRRLVGCAASAVLMSIGRHNSIATRYVVGKLSTVAVGEQDNLSRVVWAFLSSARGERSWRPPSVAGWTAGDRRSSLARVSGKATALWRSLCWRRILRGNRPARWRCGWCGGGGRFRSRRARRIRSR